MRNPTGTTDRGYLTDASNKLLLEQHAVVTPRLYVVALCCAMDNLIVKTFAHESEAVEFMRDNPPYPSPARRTTTPDPNKEAVQNALRVYGTDVGSVYGYEMMTLHDGVPADRKLFWWEDTDCMWTPADGWYVDFAGTIQPVGETDVEMGEPVA